MQYLHIVNRRNNFSRKKETTIEEVADCLAKCAGDVCQYVARSPYHVLIIFHIEKYLLLNAV